MRLSSYEIKSIKNSFIEIFEGGDIYLFGSRVDDSKKGGDIDLYIDYPFKIDVKQMQDMKSKFRLKLYEQIGEQKIDLIISKDKNRSIEKDILGTGVLL